MGVIGTPRDAVAHLKKLESQAGGFGCFLQLYHEWANWPATQHHFELFARYVAPAFQGSTVRQALSEKAARGERTQLYARQQDAIASFSAKAAQPAAAATPTP
jgi:limonene 1,2-monooxygenase